MTEHEAARVFQPDDPLRLAALDRLGILETMPEPGFDDIVLLAAQICETPAAIVSFIEKDRQWFKAATGFEACETPLERSVCAQTLGQRGLQVVPDLTLDPRTRDNPSVTGAPHLRFYAGARLENTDGLTLGTLCVVDAAPRPAGLSTAQAVALEALARQVMAQLDLRQAALDRDAAHEHLRERVLRDKALEFEALAENVSQLAWMAEADGTIFWFNKRWYLYTGTDLEAMRGWGWHSVHRPDAVEAVLAEVRGHWAAGAPWESIFHLRSASGEYRPFLTRVEPIRNEAGEIVRWFGTNTDIGAQLEAERQLRDLTSTLEQRVEERTLERDRIWHVSQDMLGMADADGVWRSVNPAWSRILGWPTHAFLGKTSAWLLHADDQDQAQAVRDSLAAGRTTTFEGRYRTIEGRYRLLSWIGVPSEGKIYSVARDITLDRERELALRDSTDFARLALSAVGGIGVWTYDLRGDRYVCDAAICEMYGLDPQHGAAGIPRSDFLANVHPDDLPALRATLASGLARSGDIELEYRIRHPDGSTRWVLSKGHTYLDEAGRPLRRTGVGIDRTKPRLIEEQLRQAQKMEAVGQLTGGVAHDFNNLLTVIQSSVDLLQRPNLTEDRRSRYITAIADTTTRAAKLTGQLLAFARRQSLKPEIFEVGRSVTTISDMVGTLTGARVRIEIQVPEEPCFVNADPSQFDTAIVNMAINARDAMNGEGRLVMAVRVLAAIPAVRAHPTIAGEVVAVSLTDTGSGIAPAQIEHIFEPFFTTKGVGHGTGLGLSQVFGFAKQSGGEVRVESEPGVGTTFTLYFPRAAGRAPARAKRAAEPPVEGHGLRVLVVEDNEDVGLFATQTLEELGYDVRLATDAAQALATLASTAPGFDVVFSDVVMPGMNGVELAHEIGRRHPGLAVVLTSGYSEVLAQDGTVGFEFLHKPYSVDGLSRALTRAAGL